MYGSKEIIPIEIEIPSLQVSLKDIVNNEEYWAARIIELEFQDKRFLSVLNHLQIYQNRLKRIYNRKIKNRNFQLGDLLLKENQKVHLNQDGKGKFKPNWLGPFIITTNYRSRAYQLDTPKGEPLVDPLNNIHLKRYHT